jgi:hypothetical protein
MSELPEEMRLQLAVELKSTDTKAHQGIGNL